MNYYLKHLIFCVAALLIPAAVRGQEFRSTLSGVVEDQTGAAVAGAKVTAVSLDTGSRSGTVSGNDGTYTIPILTPGQYQLTAEMNGFKKYVQGPIRISTYERQRQDVRLEVGNNSESITVT